MQGFSWSDWSNESLTVPSRQSGRCSKHDIFPVAQMGYQSPSTMEHRQDLEHVLLQGGTSK